MPESEPGVQKGKRRRRSRTDTLLVFDPAQKVPEAVLGAILEEWLVPCLVEQFLGERGITRNAPAGGCRPLGQGPELTQLR
jgi:hypothetical protein